MQVLNATSQFTEHAGVVEVCFCNMYIYHQPVHACGAQSTAYIGRLQAAPGMQLICVICMASKQNGHVFVCAIAVSPNM